MNKKPRFVKLIRIVAILIVLVIILEGWMVSRLSTYGDKIDQLQQIKASLNLDNELLRNQISEKTALSKIELQANQLGFSSATKVKYLKDESP